MGRKTPSTPGSGRRIRDARGRDVTQLDPVAMYVLNQDRMIPADTLRQMADEIRPGARRQALLQICTVIFSFLFIVGGNVVYFRFFSSWKGLDPVNVTIYGIQLLVILGGPFLAYRVVRQTYSNHIASVMLEYSRCPHCGYDIHGLPADPADGTTVCPECGCAWKL
jgi:hypothetical protein